MEVLCGVLLLLVALSQGYKIGVGRADMTGPAVEVAFVGYAKPEQRGTGIHLRQFARTFMVDDGQSRLVFVSADTGMMATGLRTQVLQQLKQKYNETYSEQNVMLSGTHTHSTPGGFLMDVAFDLNSLGFVRETFDAYVSGIVRSISRAHDSLEEGGRVSVTRGKVTEANINRSPAAYLNNPKQERDQYEHNTDQTLLQLKLSGADGRPRGVLTWFAVHATSMNNTNTLVSSDNVGYASLLMEQRLDPGSLAGKGSVVAAFASTNLGDVSPNILGPKCQPSGSPCDPVTSACPGEERCIASGPGRDIQQSTSIIAHRIFQQAWEVWQQEGEEVQGPVKVVHQYVEMPAQKFNYTDPFTGKNFTVQGCSPAMGYSFAAGTTDGPGMFSFKQGTKSTNPLWNLVTDILAKPSEDMVACQAPKPILLATGEMNFPFEWQPSIVSTQLALLGQLGVACVPAEFTTMSGRRLRRTLGRALGLPAGNVVVAGLCNTYADYVATPEEYQVQRYEGASTIFGPQTLTIYQELYANLAHNLLQGQQPAPGPEPPVALNKLISLLPGVIYDYAGWGKRFGQVTLQPEPSLRPNDTARAVFVAGNPRNDLMQERTFLTVERLLHNDTWQVVATDADWDTKFVWRRLSTILGTSEAEVRWQVPPATRGTFRFRHCGAHKHLTGQLYPYCGTTSPFQVIEN